MTIRKQIAFLILGQLLVAETILAVEVRLSAYARALHHDLYRIAATPAEVNEAVGQLEFGNPRVLLRMVTSRKSWRRQIITYYHRYLERHPTEDRVTQWLDEIEGSRLSWQDVQVRFLTSPEFLESCQTNEGYVRELYRVALNRVPSQAEVDYHAARIPAVGERGVAQGFVLSDEFRKNTIASWYRWFLRREARPTELDRGLTTIKQRSPEQALVNLLKATEYQTLVTRFW